jgi:hypothetical protein
MKGRGINNLAKPLDSSPSPQPSPVKGEGLFWTFWDFIKFGDRGHFFILTPVSRNLFFFVPPFAGSDIRLRDSLLGVLCDLCGERFG